MQAPHFVIAGHPKCGSTTLQTYLNAHPQLCMGPAKEPSLYLERWADWQRGDLSYYPATLGPNVLRGDATVGYVKAPVVAQRIAKTNPDTKILFLVRDPVARALSHYHHWLRHGKDTRSISQVIRESKPDDYFYLFGHYGTHWWQYRDYFPAGQMEVLFFEDLVKDAESALRPVWEFLAVDSPPTVPKEVWKNAGQGVRSRWLSGWLKQQKESQRWRAWLPGVIRKRGGAALRWMERKNQADRRQEPTAEESRYLKALYQPEVQKMAEALRLEKGRIQFPDWVGEYFPEYRNRG